MDGVLLSCHITIQQMRGIVNCLRGFQLTSKYRRKIIYNQIKQDVAEIIKDLCKWKGVEIIAAPSMIDHIHSLASIPPKMSMASFKGYLKGKSAMIIFNQQTNLKYKFGNRHFWLRGYYVSTV